MQIQWRRFRSLTDIFSKCFSKVFYLGACFLITQIQIKNISIFQKFLSQAQLQAVVEAYSEHRQTSKMVLLAKTFNSLQLFTVFVKSSILDGRMGSEYASVKPLKNTSRHEYFSQISQKPTPLQTHPWEGPYNFRAVIFKKTYGRVRL